MTTRYHNPVLLGEAIAGLAIRPSGIYVDATFGGGGHAKAILEALNVSGKLFAFDQDEDAEANAFNDNRLVFLKTNFRHMKRYLKFNGTTQVNGIIADFGVSSYQLDQEERGFSTRYDARLDMRMDQSQSLDAHQVVNGYSETQLSDILFRFGELKNARQIARRICEQRKDRSIDTTFELKACLRRLVPARNENKVLARIFQAIRIEVNKELDALEAFLEQSASLLVEGGRLVCVSYHSLEDRLVKRFIQAGNVKGVVEKDFYGNKKVPFKNVGKLLVPDPEEIKNNSRARSAKLRIAEKTGMV